MSNESLALGVQTDLLRQHGFLPPLNDSERFYRRFEPGDYELFASIVGQGQCMARLGKENDSGDYVHVVPFGIAINDEGVLVCRKADGKANGLSGTLSFDIGGHIDRGDKKDPLHCLKREFGEEALIYDEFGAPVEMRADPNMRPGNDNANIGMVDELVTMQPLGIVYDGSNRFNPNYLGMPFVVQTVNPGHRIALNPFNDETDWSGYIPYCELDDFMRGDHFTAANWPDIVIAEELERIAAMGVGV